MTKAFCPVGVYSKEVLQTTSYTFKALALSIYDSVEGTPWIMNILFQVL